MWSWMSIQQNMNKLCKGKEWGITVRINFSGGCKTGKSKNIHMGAHTHTRMQRENIGKKKKKKKIRNCLTTSCNDKVVLVSDILSGRRYLLNFIHSYIVRNFICGNSEELCLKYEITNSQARKNKYLKSMGRTGTATVSTLEGRLCRGRHFV